MTIELFERNRGRFEEIAGLIRSGQRFLVATHTGPDGDALGSLLAMGEALRGLGKQVTMYCQDRAPVMYEFLPGLEEMTDTFDPADDYDLLLLLDCHTLQRVGAGNAAFKRIPLMAVLDHHLGDDFPTEYGVVDTGASAAGELVWHLLSLLKVKPTSSLATNLFVAISTDTGSFSFDNTTSEALAVAAELVEHGARPWDIFSRLYLNRSPGRLELLGLALKGLEIYYQGRLGVITVTSDMMTATGTTSFDTDGFVEYPRSLKGAELAVLFRQAGPDTYKVSLRSKGRCNAAALAGKFGGGGHYQAAGFTLRGRLPQVKERLITATASYLPPLDEGEVK